MKETFATVHDMVEVYKKQIRCLTETGCAAWNETLTIKDKIKLEKLQKTALRIILGNDYFNYDNALQILNLEKLEKRRDKICRKFARTCERSSKFSKWFTKASRITKSNTRYIIPSTRTQAYRRSPLMYLTRLLNENK